MSNEAFIYSEKGLTNCSHVPFSTANKDKHVKKKTHNNVHNYLLSGPHLTEM